MSRCDVRRYGQSRSHGLRLERQRLVTDGVHARVLVPKAPVAQAIRDRAPPDSNLEELLASDYSLLVEREGGDRVVVPLLGACMRFTVEQTGRSADSRHRPSIGRVAA
jgi:hypothetical protein